MKNFDKLYTKIILETKQEFSLLQYKSELIPLFDNFLEELRKNISDAQQLIEDYIVDVKFYLYKALRYKPKNQNLSSINSELEQAFFLNVIKNVQDMDDLSRDWVKFYFSYDNTFDRYEYRKTFNRYITPDIEYTENDLLILQKALTKLSQIVNSKACNNKTNLAIKYNPYFNQYFQQNDNVKLYCFKQQDIPLLEQIQQQFLKLLSKQNNNRLYFSGYDERRSYGEIIAINIARDILTYATQVNYNITSQQLFQYLVTNFEEQIKKFTN